MTAEPWCPIPPDPDPVCGHCGEPTWNDRTASCDSCGDTIYDVAERIAADTKKGEAYARLTDRYSRMQSMSFDEARSAGVPEEVINAALIEADQMVYGVSYTDVTGKRIDPSTVGKAALARAQAISDHQTQGGPE